MTEQALISAAEQALTPLAATLLEDLHQAASAEITRLEASMPARITSAETVIQDWATDAIGAYHRLIAHIDAARSGAPATAPTPAAKPTTPPKPQA